MSKTYSYIDILPSTSTFFYWLWDGNIVIPRCLCICNLKINIYSKIYVNTNIDEAIFPPVFFFFTTLFICWFFFIYFSVPPNIDDSQSSSDAIVRENANVTLTCKATGSPTPSIRWKRDDNEKITINKSLEGNKN